MTFDAREYQAGRRKAGLCVTCGKPSPERVRCGECRRRDGDRQKAKRDAARQRGDCLACKKVVAAEGHSFCAACLPKQNEATRRHRAKAKAQGRCGACGDPADAGTLCGGCADANRTVCRSRRRRLQEEGTCRDCGREATLRDLLNKRLSYYCQTCYLKMMARGVLGSAKHWQVLLDKLYRCGWRCAYTGEELVLGQNLSFDHADPVARFPERKHDPRNVEPVCLAVNLAKRDLTKAEFLALVGRIMRHNSEDWS